MNKENPAAAGAVFDSDYALLPSDDIRSTNSIEEAKQITSKPSSLDGDIKNMDSKLLRSLGKLKHGEEATHKVFEQQIGKITILQTRVRDINKNLMEWPFSQLTFLICMTMYLNMDVRQFRAETAKLPEIASHPRYK